MAKELTQRQREVLQFIVEFKRKHEMPPTRDEIAEHFGFSSVNSAVCNIKALTKKGYIQTSPNLSRGMRVVKELLPL